jgi:hypothetical protein
VNRNPHLKASSTDPTTWASFEETRAAHLTGDFDGIGFVLTTNDPLVGVGLDDVINPETGEIDPWAAEIVDKLASYTEISPSGTGIRIFVKGSLAGLKGRKKGKFEIYDSGRFLTVTGNIYGYGTPRDIEDRQSEIEDLHMRVWPPKPKRAPRKPVEPVNADDVTVIERCRSNKTGAKFNKLWDGDFSDYSSQSEAELALCNFLRFESGDAGQVDRLFRQSGLMREKWDEVHYSDGATYGQHTVDLAMDGEVRKKKGPKPKTHPQAKAAKPKIRPQGTAAPPQQDAKTAGTYADYGNVLYHRKTNMEKHDKKWVEVADDTALCNFTARITRQLTVDDGAETRRELTLEGALETGQPLPTATVGAAQFSSFNWLTDQWGALAIINAGQASKDRLREAIQRFSAADGIENVTTYAHLGWRKMGSEWVYLHAGGGVTADAVVDDLSVTAGDALNAYTLELPDEGRELEALGASLSFLELAPKMITVPLWLSMYRAVMARADFSIYPAGPTGVFKTTLALLVLSHFGRAIAGPDYAPASYEAIGNYLEELAFACKDAPLLVDDYAPQADKRSRDEYQRTAARLMRVQGNRTGRGRLRPDGTRRPQKPPRGLIITTGEDLPKGHSLRTRALVIELQKGDVDKEHLTALQHHAQDGLLVQAMTLFIQWLAGRVDDLPQRLQAGREHYRAYFPSAHGRSTDTCAELMFTADVLEAWLSDYRLSLDRQMVYDTLLEVAGAQAEHQTDQDDTHRFLAYLSAVLSSGHAHLVTHKGFEPNHSSQYGWQSVLYHASTENERWVSTPKGPKIGWLADDGAYLLEPAATFAAVQQLAADSEDTLGITATTLWKRLAEVGLSQSLEPDRNTYKATVEGKRMRCN